MKKLKNDLIQIFATSTFLVALCASGWALYYHNHRHELLAERDLNAKNILQLQVELKSPENKEAVERHLAMSRASQSDETLGSTVMRTVKSIPRHATVADSRSYPAKGDEIVRHEFDLSFDPASIREDGLMAFVNAIERDSPLISFQEVKFIRRDRSDGTDRWSSEYKLVTYEPTGVRKTSDKSPPE